MRSFVVVVVVPYRGLQGGGLQASTVWFLHCDVKISRSNRQHTPSVIVKYLFLRIYSTDIDPI